MPDLMMMLLIVSEESLARDTDTQTQARSRLSSLKFALQTKRKKERKKERKLQTLRHPQTRNELFKNLSANLRATADEAITTLFLPLMNLVTLRQSPGYFCL